MDHQCRVCQILEANGFISVFEISEGNLISDMLTATTDTVIDEYDRLPQYLCQQCLNHLIQIYCTRKRYRSFHLLPKCQKGQEDDYYRCRVCAKIEVEELVSLHCEYAEEKLKIADVIRLTTGVTIGSWDCLPPYICNICLNELGLWYKFKKQLLQSEKDLVKQALFAWEKMEYEPTRPGHLVVDLYADVIFSRKNGVILHCSVCKLTVPWEQLDEKCEGCLLQFRNIKEIRQNVLKSGLLSTPNCDLDDTTSAEMFNEATPEPFLSIQSESPVPTQIIYKPIGSHTTRLFEVVEAYSDGPFYRLRRKGPTCCGCDVFFLSEEELSEHLQLKHFKDAGKASFKCAKCNSGFSQHFVQAAHINKLKQDTYYHCSECNMIMLDWHTFADHKTLPHLTLQQRKAVSGKFTSKSSTVYTCCVKLCEKQYSNQKQLLEHCNEVHSPATDLNESTCRYCRKQFRNNVQFARHMDREKVVLTFICQIDDCSYKTNRETSILLHCLRNPHINTNRPKQSSGKTYVPDLKHFVVVGSTDANTDILETKSEVCCGCSNLFENQEELEKHLEKQHAAVEGDYPIRCTRCNRGFRLKRDLTRHNKNAVSRNFYYCRPCKMLLRTHCSFKHHKAEAHMNVKEEEIASGQFTTYSTDSYICCGCFQQFLNEEELVEHRRVSHPVNQEEGFKCDLCNRRFTYFCGLKRHKKLFSGKKVYKCKVSDCVYETKDFSRIKFHVLNTLHTNLNGKTQNLYNPNPSIYRCCSYGCQFKCVSYDEMIKHGVTRHIEQRERFTTKYGDKKIKCPVCLKGFDQEFHLLNHRNGKPRLRCEYCQELFPIKDFDAHYEKCKLVPKITCGQCPKQFVNSLLVKKHVEKCHNLSKLVCNVCGVSVKKYKLVAHMQSHENKRPYKCKLCPKSFNHELNYTRHALVHTGAKPYPCRQGCENRYKAAVDRDRHEKSVHLGIKPFSCEMCPKAFVRQRDLRLHQRTHTGLKLYNCKFCNEGFDVMKLFNEHMESCVQNVE